MILNRITYLYNWIDKLNPNVKTLLIIFLMGVMLLTYYNYDRKNIIKSVWEMGDTEKVIAENYTKTYTTLINNKVERVLYRDPDAIHVILLNYHNTLTSSHGLSYRYLTSITEKRKAQAHKPCFRIFKELDYLNYGQEIQRINELKYLRIDSISKYEHEYPNFMELLKICGTPSAAFYPIHGTHDYIGMLIVLYNKPKEYQLGYYQRVLHEPLQDLAILLDYNSVKNEYIKKYLEAMR